MHVCTRLEVGQVLVLSALRVVSALPPGPDHPPPRSLYMLSSEFTDVISNRRLNVLGHFNARVRAVVHGRWVSSLRQASAATGPSVAL